VATNKRVSCLSQQDLLRLAMEQLNMTRDEFAVRIRVSRRALDKWLLPDESNDFRPLPDMGRGYVEEILTWHKKKA
jgi:DNA-binding transcriptional regulator YiaG